MVLATGPTDEEEEEVTIVSRPLFCLKRLDID
jgi:hypothetical protein